MKKVIMTITAAIIVLAGFNNALAEMVDIGMGQMDRSEFLALKKTVQEGSTIATPAITTPLVQVERYGPVEMSRADFDALRNKVAGVGAVGASASIVTPVVQTVNIGTGEMPMDEFLALKRMVAKSSHAFAFNPLAAVKP